MVLIYVNIITSRVSYIFDHTFTNLLGIKFEFTTQVNDFVAHSGAKFSYSNIPLGEEFNIQSHRILFEKGINDVEIDIGKWEGLPSFFQTTSRSAVPFDLFATSFFLLSRYEECLPSIRDKHSRYNYKNSVAFQNGFLNRPIVDLWAQKFGQLLKSKFPELVFTIPKSQKIFLIDISELYAFRKKGFFRNFGGIILDMKALNFDRIWLRITTLMGIKKDPYDLLEAIVEIHEKHKIPVDFFALVGDFGIYDKAVSFKKSRFRSYLKSIADYYNVNFLISHEGAFSIDRIEMERERLQNILRRTITKSRFHFNRLRIPASYRHLVDLEFVCDYSMGYHDIFGFRAGTCTPFTYYDPMYEIKYPLEIHPFCVHRHAIPKDSNVKNQIDYYKKQIEEVGGVFISVMSNSFLSQVEDWKDFYEDLIV